MKRFVYGLIDPVTREMRHVGATTAGMKRPRSHLRSAIYDGSGKNREWHLYRWIRSVVASGGLPEIVVIEYAADDESPLDLEMGWVSYFRGIGCRLTNETDGGEGRIGYKASQETCAKLKGRVFSEETKRKMSESAKKRFENGMPPEMKAKISAKNAFKGRSLPQEMKDRMSEGQRRSHASGLRKKRKAKDDPNQRKS